MCLEFILNRGRLEVRGVMRKSESRLWRTMVLNPGCSLESLRDLSANIDVPTIKPMKSTFQGSDPQNEYLFKAHWTMSNGSQGGKSLVGPCR